MFHWANVAAAAARAPGLRETTRGTRRAPAEGRRQAAARPLVHCDGRLAPTHNIRAHAQPKQTPLPLFHLSM